MRLNEKIMKLSELSKFGSESLNGIKILLQSKEREEKEDIQKQSEKTFVLKGSDHASRTAANVKLTRSLQRKMKAA